MATKTLIYKVARFNKEVYGKNLQDLLTTALNQRKNATSRKQEIGSSTNHFRLINDHTLHGEIRCGDFFDYTQGNGQPYAKIDNNAGKLDVLTLLPPDSNSEFLHSILYFGVWKNSVILSQSLSLRVPQFEAYLNWLIIEECKLLGNGLAGDGDYLFLSDYAPEKLQTEIFDTKDIEFHAPLFFENENEQQKNSKVNPALAAFRAMLPKELLPFTTKKNDILLNNALEVSLKVKWSPEHRKNDSTTFLDTLSNQLRHIDDELDYTIHTKSGTITPKDFKLKKAITLNSTKEGRINELEIWDEMELWLDTLISEKRINQNS